MSMSEENKNKVKALWGKAISEECERLKLHLLEDADAAVEMFPAKGLDDITQVVKTSLGRWIGGYDRPNDGSPDANWFLLLGLVDEWDQCCRKLDAELLSKTNNKTQSVNERDE